MEPYIRLRWSLAHKKWLVVFCDEFEDTGLYPSLWQALEAIVKFLRH